ncbi:glycosyltransferase [Aureimonas leprariae]|nr:glycosyltransferase [Aureimonas leprariae]
MIDRRILQEARTLAAAGHRIELLSGFECRQADAYEDGPIRIKRYRYDWQDRRRAVLNDRVGRQAARYLWPPVRLLTRLSDGPNAFEAFVLEKAMEHDFDVVHVHDFPMLRCGAMAAARRDVPLVYDSHEFYPIQSHFAPEDQKRYLRQEKALVRRCASVITVNPYIAGMMADAHGIQPPEVILNACEPPVATAADLDAGQRRDRRIAKALPPDDFLFLYQGWLSAERNLEPMIEATARQRDGVKLVVVGYGEYEASLHRLAAEVGAADRVIFLGRIENEVLSEITSLCDVGIVPYRAVDEMHRYCSPNKLFEFIAAQIPVVASDLPYLRDIVDGYSIGWLADLEKVDAFASALAVAATDADGMAASRTNLGRAWQELNWVVEGEKLIRIYEGLDRGR